MSQHEAARVPYTPASAHRGTAPRYPETAEHLVKDEQRAMLRAQLPQALQRTTGNSGCKRARSCFRL